MNYHIRYYGDPVLRTQSKRVESIDEDFGLFAEQLVEMMYEYDGVGLAAPQVGVSKRVFAVDDGTGSGWKVVINPEIIRRSQETETNEEGCLSVPEIYESVQRPKKITVRYQNLKGEIVEESLEGYPAVVFQHETDHLNGILFIDHLSVTKRRLLHRALTDIQRRAVPRMDPDFEEPHRLDAEPNPKAKETF